MHPNPTTATNAAEFQKVGRAFILDRWTHLTPQTRAALRRTGCYDAEGGVLESLDAKKADVDALSGFEVALGTLRLVTMRRADVESNVAELVQGEGARIALLDEVTFSCELLLVDPALRDPEFLRLGLMAVESREFERSLAAIPAQRFAWTPSAQGLKLALMSLAICAFAIGMALNLANAAGPASALFPVSTAFLLAGAAALLPRKMVPSQAQLSFDAWHQFRRDRGVGSIGAGDAHRLSQMAHAGVRVPLVAFDLCAALLIQAQAAATP